MIINVSSRCHDDNILPGHVHFLGEPFMVPVYRREFIMLVKVDC